MKTSADIADNGRIPGGRAIRSGWPHLYTPLVPCFWFPRVWLIAREEYCLFRHAFQHMHQGAQNNIQKGRAYCRTLNTFYIKGSMQWNLCRIAWELVSHFSLGVILYVYTCVLGQFHLQLLSSASLAVPLWRVVVDAQEHKFHTARQWVPLWARRSVVSPVKIDKFVTWGIRYLG